MGSNSQAVNQLVKSRRFLSYYTSNAPLISPFVNVRFDRVFWTFFLTDQIFQYETGFESRNVTLYDHPEFGENLRMIIMKHNQGTSTYIDGTYPTFKSYNGKYMGQDSDVESSYEYSVSYY